MKCTDVQHVLVEDPEAAASQDAVSAHLLTCEACRATQAQLGEIEGALRAQPVPALPRGFEPDLTRRLMEAVEDSAATAGDRKVSTGRWRSWIAQLFDRPAIPVAVAVAALLAVGAALWLQSRSTSVPAPTYHRLELAVRTAVERQEALIDIDLPDGVQVAPELARAFGATRQLRLRSALRRGVNEIALPLLASETSGGPVQVRLQVGQTRLRREVALDPPSSASGPRTRTRVQLALLVPLATTVDEGGR